MRGRNRRQRVTDAFEEFHDAAAAALGAARGLSEAATRAHAEAMVEMWLRTDGIDAARADPALRDVLANPQVSAAVDRVTADRDAAFAGWLDTGPARLTGIFDAAAPGSAGLPPDRWLRTPGTTEADGPVPGLWRIGTDPAVSGRPRGPSGCRCSTSRICRSARSPRPGRPRSCSSRCWSCGS